MYHGVPDYFVEQIEGIAFPIEPSVLIEKYKKNFPIIFNAKNFYELKIVQELNNISGQFDNVYLIWLLFAYLKNFIDCFQYNHTRNTGLLKDKDVFKIVDDTFKMYLDSLDDKDAVRKISKNDRMMMFSYFYDVANDVEKYVAMGDRKFMLFENFVIHSYSLKEMEHKLEI